MLGLFSWTCTVGRCALRVNISRHPVETNVQRTPLRQLTASLPISWDDANDHDRLAVVVADLGISDNAIISSEISRYRYSAVFCEGI